MRHFNRLRDLLSCLMLLQVKYNQKILFYFSFFDIGILSMFTDKFNISYIENPYEYYSKNIRVHDEKMEKDQNHLHVRISMSCHWALNPLKFYVKIIKMYSNALFVYVSNLKSPLKIENVLSFIRTLNNSNIENSKNNNEPKISNKNHTNMEQTE